MAVTMTPKQEIVLKHLKAGRKAAEIAGLMGNSPNAVYNLIRKMKEAGVNVPDSPGRASASTNGAKTTRGAPATRRAPRAVVDEVPNPRAALVSAIQSFEARVGEIDGILAEREELVKLIDQHQAALRALDGTLEAVKPATSSEAKADVKPQPKAAKRGSTTKAPAKPVAAVPEPAPTQTVAMAPPEPAAAVDVGKPDEDFFDSSVPPGRS